MCMDGFFATSPYTTCRLVIIIRSLTLLDTTVSWFLSTENQLTMLRVGACTHSHYKALFSPPPREPGVEAKGPLSTLWLILDLVRRLC